MGSFAAGRAENGVLDIVGHFLVLNFRGKNAALGGKMPPEGARPGRDLDIFGQVWTCFKGILRR
jgi:hypothetical protein